MKKDAFKKPVQQMLLWNVRRESRNDGHPIRLDKKRNWI